MALYRAIDDPSEGESESEEALPFRAAIFICGGVPLSALEDMGLEVSPRAHEINHRTGKQLNETAARLTEMAANTQLIKRGVGLWDGNEGRLIHGHAHAHAPKQQQQQRRRKRSDVFGLDFTRFPTAARIRLPTVHVYGSKDPRWPAAIQLAEFCDDRLEYDHGRGHDIPRSTEVSNKIADMIKRVMGQIHC